MRGPGGGRPRRGNDKRAAVEAMPSGQVARGGADVWGDMSTRATTDRRQKTPPTAYGLGSSTTATPLAPFPSKGSPGEIQAGVLARGTPLLSAPSQGLTPQWSVQISFRSQLRGSASLAPDSLLTAPCCEAPWLSSTSQLVVHLITIACALQDKWCRRCSRRCTHPLTTFPGTRCPSIAGRECLALSPGWPGLRYNLNLSRFMVYCASRNPLPPIAWRSGWSFTLTPNQARGV